MQNSLPTILIVDDEEKMLAMLRNYLEQDGFKVITAMNGEEALKLIKADSYISLVVLDWMMPGMNGLDVCRAIRNFRDIPVIFLTAKSDEVDKLLGLELGADDYITKPFSLRELAARIRVVLRRVQKPAPNEAVQTDRLEQGDLTVCFDRHAVLKAGKEVLLTPTEFNLLATLAASPGRVFSRLQLLEVALGEEYAGYERSIDTHISNLRRKIEPDPANPLLILTVFGVGYKFGESL